MTTFQQKPTLQLIKQNVSYKLIVEESLEKIIRHICARYPNNEWSGTLFYTVEGSFEENNLVIRAKDFYVQDIGGGAYTEFKNDASLAGYMVEHELWDCYTGLQHSHCSFSTFFSGTDLSTLQSEGSEQNHFVSLIVNNAGPYTAAITRRVKGTRHTVTEGTETLSYKSFGDEEKVIDNKPLRSESTSDVEYIEYYMLDVEVEHAEYERASLDLRLDELQHSANSYINRGRAISYPKSTEVLNTPTLFSKQPKTLFDEDAAYVKSSAKVIDVENGTIDYDSIHIEEGIVISHVKQLITLNFFAGNNPKVDLKQWGDNMITVLSRRFPNINDYGYVIEAIIDVLYNELDKSKLYETLGDDATAAIWANDIIQYIEHNIAENEYTKVIIDNISRWLI